MSGPQVVEGWHGVAYDRPLRTTEEYVAVVRQILARDEEVQFDGERYQLPYRGPGSTGLGKALRPALRTRHRIPVYLAAIGPRNVALAARIADGLLPMLWNPHRRAAFDDSLRDAPDGFEIAATVPVALGNDIAACREEVRPLLALYIGGMGARGRNFYNALVRRYGFEEAADAVQDAYLDGRRRDAIALVPDALVDELAVVGPRESVAEQLDAWRASGVTTFVVATPTEDRLRTLAELAL